MDKATAGATAPDELNSPEERKRAVYAAFASGDPRFDRQVFASRTSRRRIA